MNLAIALIITILWLIFGSFWSVLLGRLSEKCDRKTIKSILIGRSQCPKCKTTLWASELIPLGSYLRQRGKCKHCKTPISPEYPILEIASALVFLITYIAISHTNTDINTTANLIFRLGTNRFLMLLIIHDSKTFELHLPIWILLMVRIRWREIIGNIGSYEEAVIWTIVCLWFFWAIYIFGKRYVKLRFKANEEWFGQWDIYIWATLWSLFPLIWTVNNIPITWPTAIEITLMIIILACLIWILYYFWEQLWAKKTPTKDSKNLFNKRRNTNKIIPFIPALILAFWIILCKANLLISLVF